MNDPITGKKKIREILAMAPRSRFTERMILDALNLMMPQEATTAELAEWIEFNHSRGWIEYRKNPDAGNREEWFLTDDGKQKEGL